VVLDVGRRNGCVRPYYRLSLVVAQLVFGVLGHDAISPPADQYTRRRAREEYEIAYAEQTVMPETCPGGNSKVNTDESWLYGRTSLSLKFVQFLGSRACGADSPAAAFERPTALLALSSASCKNEDNKSRHSIGKGRIESHLEICWVGLVIVVSTSSSETSKP
jgi:hypothetical protein